MVQFKKLDWSIDQVWLTSDTHISHKNICKGTTNWDLEHSNQCRDFDTIEEMNDEIINNINKNVKETDLLIHHGDWSFGGHKNIEEFRNRISCKNIILLQGNHDHNVPQYKHLFLDFLQIGYFQVEWIKFVSCHFPISIWHQSHKDVVHFYGHVHGSFQNVGKSLDVGVDNIVKLEDGYSPIILRKAYNIVNSKQTYLESHHNKNTN